MTDLNLDTAQDTKLIELSKELTIEEYLACAEDAFGDDLYTMAEVIRERQIDVLADSSGDWDDKFKDGASVILGHLEASIDRAYEAKLQAVSLIRQLDDIMHKGPENIATCFDPAKAKEVLAEREIAPRQEPKTPQESGIHTDATTQNEPINLMKRAEELRFSPAMNKIGQLAAGMPVDLKDPGAVSSVAANCLAELTGAMDRGEVSFTTDVAAGMHAGLLALALQLATGQAKLELEEQVVSMH